MEATSNLEDALVALEKEEQVKLRELTEIQLTKEKIERLIGVRPSQTARATVSLEYQGLGSLEAAQRFLTERNEPLTTREIVDGMFERGWTTRSRNPVPSVYAVLTNAKTKFKRVGDKWDLVK